MSRDQRCVMTEFPSILEQHWFCWVILQFLSLQYLFRILLEAMAYNQCYFSLAKERYRLLTGRQREGLSRAVCWDSCVRTTPATLPLRIVGSKSCCEFFRGSFEGPKGLGESTWSPLAISLLLNHFGDVSVAWRRWGQRITILKRIAAANGVHSTPRQGLCNHTVNFLDVVNIW